MKKRKKTSGDGEIQPEKDLHNLKKAQHSKGRGDEQDSRHHNRKAGSKAAEATKSAKSADNAVNAFNADNTKNTESAEYSEEKINTRDIRHSKGKDGLKIKDYGEEKVKDREAKHSKAKSYKRNNILQLVPPGRDEGRERVKLLLNETEENKGHGKKSRSPAKKEGNKREENVISLQDNNKWKRPQRKEREKREKYKNKNKKQNRKQNIRQNIKQLFFNREQNELKPADNPPPEKLHWKAEEFPRERIHWKVKEISPGEADMRETGPVSWPLHSILRIILGLILAAAGALCLTLAFPPYEIWPLVLVGFVPILLSLHRIMPRRLSGLALGVGIGGFFYGYFYGMFRGTGNPYMEYIPYVMGIIAALIGFRERQFHERTHYRFFILQGAMIWVGMEFIRSLFPLPGTWGFLPYSLYAQFWFIQPVSIFSIYGLSFLIIIINYALGLKTIAWFDAGWYLEKKLHPVSTIAARRWVTGVAMLLVIWAGYSLALLDTPQPMVRVAAVQPGLFRHETELADGSIKEIVRDKLEYQEDLDLLMARTREAARKGARIIVWPAGILPVDPQKTGASVFKEFTGEIDAFLAIGYRVTDDPDSYDEEYAQPLLGIPADETDRLRKTVAQTFSEVTFLSPDGVFLGVYRKGYLGGENHADRRNYPVYQTLLGSVGTLIGDDINNPDKTRRLTRNGARLVLISSDDRPAIATRHYTYMVFRAVESGVTMVKADTHYNSAIIDPHGRIIEKAVFTSPMTSTLSAHVPMGSGDTFVVTWGDWMGLICLTGMITFFVLDALMSLVDRKKYRREERDNSEDYSL